MYKPPLKDFNIGEIFPGSRLRILEQRPSQKRYKPNGVIRSTRPRVLVQCLCKEGKIFECSWGDVKSGNTTSCGCLGAEHRLASKVTHGLSGSKIFMGLLSKIARCENPKVPAYKHYGARGISVFQGWKDDPQSYVDYILSLHPDAEELLAQGYHVDRINNDGNYEPGNVRIITQTENKNNTRANVFIEVFGERITIAMALKKYGRFSNLKRSGFTYREHVGWDLERALITPVCRGRRLPENYSTPLSEAERQAVIDQL